MSTISLVKSAFGCKATLYTVLNCTKTSSQSELRSAYRKAALRFHPDRANSAMNNNDGNGDTTLKFQAVSAAYQVLMDGKKRVAYDATGRVLEEYDGDTYYGSSSEDDDEGNQHVPRSRSQKQQQWEDFFHSIFNEIISAGCKHEDDAKLYYGSNQERDDVLKYYIICKGNLQKVLECIVHAKQGDIGRWRKDIIDPAISKGEVDDFFNVNATRNIIPKASKKKKQTLTLEDSSSSEDDAVTTTRSSSSRLKRFKRGKGTPKKNSSLVDTDEENDDNDEKAETHSAEMSKREKMDYRVAKKRKVRAEKEMEISKIVQSKNWDQYPSTQQKKKNRGGVSDKFLSQIEHKYAKKTNPARRRQR